jgi:hypothetical protein
MSSSRPFAGKNIQRETCLAGFFQPELQTAEDDCRTEGSYSFPPFINEMIALFHELFLSLHPHFSKSSLIKA